MEVIDKLFFFYLIQIEFRGKIGSGYAGDIAIDDIQITSLGCTLTPSNADPNPKPSVKPTTLPATRPTTPCKCGH